MTNSRICKSREFQVKDIRRKDTMLDCLKDANRAHRDLCAAQQQVVRSTMALAKNRRTKFV